MSRFTFSLAGGTGAFGATAVLVGLCCSVPVTVWLFGVSGAVLLARLEPFRPWMLGVAWVLGATHACVLYLVPLLQSRSIKRVPVEHLLFVGSLAIVIIATFIDDLLVYVI